MDLIISKAFGDTKSNQKRKHNKDCTRIIFADSSLPLLDGMHKYAEKITFNGDLDKDYAIAIGLNPAKGEENSFDSTNRKVANDIQQKKYKGYLLLNLYSVIEPNCNKLCSYIKHNPKDMRNNLQDVVLKQVLDSNNDIFIFWGPNAKEKRLLTNPYLLKILEVLLATGRKIYYSSDANNNFVHPANKNFSNFQLLANMQTLEI